jgi:hypothetical protein
MERCSANRELEDVAEENIAEEKTVVHAAGNVHGHPSIKSRNGNWKSHWPIFGLSSSLMYE